MDTIRNYLDNVFAGLPKNPQTLKLYNDLLATMEDKYRELKEAGRSENEAIGVVISEFGNIEELMEELELSAAPEPAPQAPAAPPSAKAALPVVELAEADAFLQARSLAGFLIGLGVLACILGVGLFLLLQRLFHNMEAVAFLGLLGPAAAGVALFIYSGFRGEPFKHLEKDPFQLSPETEAIIREQRGGFAPTRAKLLITGIVLLILSPNWIFWVPKNYPALGDELSLLLMLAMAGVGVCLVIIASTIYGGYQVLLQEEEHRVENKRPTRGNKVLAAIAAVWWPVVTAGYLLYSFSTGNWHSSWIVWPVSAILFGAVSGVCGILGSEDE